MLRVAAPLRGRGLRAASVLRAGSGSGSSGGSRRGLILGSDHFKPKLSVPGDANALETAIFMHGILGSRRNWRTPANMFLKKHAGEFQAFTLDHRGHGGSRDVGRGRAGANSVAACAEDLEAWLHSPEVAGQVFMATPAVLCAHSFGGKVALAFIAARRARGEPIPKHTFVLDSSPGLYAEPKQQKQEHGPNNTHQAESRYSVNSVHGIFEALRASESGSAGPGPGAPLPGSFSSPKAAVEALQSRGVALPVAQWLASGCHIPAGQQSYVWGFDLTTASALFSDFCQLDLWSALENFDGRGAALDGTDALIHYVRAGKNKMWAERDVKRLEQLQATGAGVRTVLMPNVGHWIHVDDCEGLLALITQHTR